VLCEHEGQKPGGLGQALQVDRRYPAARGVGANQQHRVDCVSEGAVKQHTALLAPSNVGSSESPSCSGNSCADEFPAECAVPGTVNTYTASRIVQVQTVQAAAGESSAAAATATVPAGAIGAVGCLVAIMGAAVIYRKRR
jgi:hypothetical protein